MLMLCEVNRVIIQSDSVQFLIQFSSIKGKIKVLMLCEINRVIIQSDSVQF